MNSSTEIKLDDARPPAAFDGRPGAAAAIRVLVVDDHPMIRLGLAAMVRAERDFEFVGEAAHGRDAISVAQATRPDVVLLDLVMPDLDGVAVVAALRPLLPRTRFVMLTSLMDAATVRRALEAGACGYMLKSASAQELVTIIRAAHAGQRVMSPEATDALIKESREPQLGQDLTPRERELLALMARGMNNQEIAATLTIAVPTVKFHITNILGKLNADNRTEAVLAAIKHRLVAPA